MSSEELKLCPFCGGDVSFHKDEECDGCHFIQCGQCRAFFDFATGADPGNDCASVDALRAAIAPMWNRRALSAQQGEAVEVAQVVSYLSACADGYDPDAPHPGPPEPLMTVAQHERIVAALSAQPQASSEQSVPVTAAAGSLRAVLAMVLQALDRDAAEGRAVRGEMAAELRAAMEAQSAPAELDFTIEDRGVCRVLVWSGDNGCRPASDAECAMWDALAAWQRTQGAVPVDPTPQMERAAEKYWNDRRFRALSDDHRTWRGLYQAMLAAASAQPAAHEGKSK